jgi:hypothetical protein
MSDFMDGFVSDPWSFSNDSFSLSSDIDTGAIISNVYGPAYDTAVMNSGSDTFGGWSWPSGGADKFLDSITKGIDYGLKVSGALRAGDLAVQNQGLQTYLAQSQMDISRTKAASAAEVAKIQATTQSNLSKMYSNAAGSGANLASMGGTSSSLMLYLTIAGVLLAFIQVMNSRRG